MKRRLLILSCSMRKIDTDSPVSAWDLYDGVSFRLLKRMQKHGEFPNDVDILIVSARYGLISPSQKIVSYNQKMTAKIACQQARDNCLILLDILSKKQYRAIFVNLGSAYLQALQPIDSWLDKNISIILAEGKIGQKLQKMKYWLKFDTTLG
jgi:hypothetical protein